MASSSFRALLVPVLVLLTTACGKDSGSSKKSKDALDPDILGGLLSKVGDVDLIGRVQPTAAPLTASVPVPENGLQLFAVGTRVVLLDPGFKQSAVFDTATKEWWAVPANDLLKDRYGAAIVATDKGIFVWGGKNNNALLQDGALLDLDARAWTTLNATGAPAPRSDAFGVWAGDRVVIFGGSTSTDGKTPAAETYAYVPASSTWSALPSLPVQDVGSPSSFDSAVVFGGGKVYLVMSSKSYGLDLAGGEWKAVSNLDLGIGNHIFFDGQAFLTWSRSTIDDSTALERLPLDKVDTKTYASSGKSYPLAGPLKDFCASTSGTRFVAWGGNVSTMWDGATDREVDDGWIYETDKDRWTYLKTVSGITARSNAACVVVGNQLFVWGGTTGGLDFTTSSTPVTGGFLLDLPAAQGLEDAAKAAQAAPAPEASDDPPLPDCAPGTSRLVGTVGSQSVDLSGSSGLMFVQGNMTAWIGGQGTNSKASVSLLFPSGLANGSSEPAWIGIESQANPSLAGSNCRFDKPASQIAISEDGKTYQFRILGPYHKGQSQIAACDGESLDVHLAGCVQSRQ